MTGLAAGTLRRRPGSWVAGGADGEGLVLARPARHLGLGDGVHLLAARVGGAVGAVVDSPLRAHHVRVLQHLVAVDAALTVLHEVVVAVVVLVQVVRRVALVVVRVDAILVVVWVPSGGAGGALGGVVGRGEDVAQVRSLLVELAHAALQRRPLAAHGRLRHVRVPVHGFLRAQRGDVGVRGRMDDKNGYPRIKQQPLIKLK